MQSSPKASVPLLDLWQTLFQRGRLGIGLYSQRKIVPPKEGVEPSGRCTELVSLVVSERSANFLPHCNSYKPTANSPSLLSFRFDLLHHRYLLVMVAGLCSWMHCIRVFFAALESARFPCPGLFSDDRCCLSFPRW